ncbi:MAG: DUF5916 domain-containing protein [Bacteroidota bacterium]|jgi:hypothetical protein
MLMTIWGFETRTARHGRGHVAVILLLLTFTCPLFAQSTKKIEAVRASEPITIDGILSEAVWQREGFSDFVQREPHEGASPTMRTEVWVAYDDAALYVAARMHDPAPDSVERRLARKDNIILADALTFFIDGYHDKRGGFYFGLNAAGTLYDGVLYNDDWSDDSWDGIWEAKARMDANGWTAEMRIPYSQFRFEQGDGNHWAVNFKRVIARRNENDYVVFTPRNGSGFVSRFIDLVGIDDINPPRRLEVLPYLTEKAEFAPHDPGDPFHTGSKYTPGLGADIKLGIGSNLTLDATVNPDFGQVEVDPAVVNLSDVETHYTEKRPFFLEGSSIFSFGQGGASSNWSFNWSAPSLIYSRRIGRTPQGTFPNADYVDMPFATHIIGAAKLSGKTGDNWSVGAISALTSRETARVDSAGIYSDRDAEPLTYYGVFRAQKEMNDGKQGLGTLITFTQRDLSDTQLKDQINNNALVTGIDGWTAFDDDKTWVITGWGAMTHVTADPVRMLALQENSQHYFQRPDVSYLHLDSAATSLTGYGGRLLLTKQKGDVIANASLGIISPGFDVNDLGYQWRSDIINMHVGGGYQWTVPTSWYRSLWLTAAGFQTYDFGGDATWRGIWQLTDIVFPNYYEVSVSYAYNTQTVNDYLTRGGPKALRPPGYEFNGSISGDSREDLIPGFNFDIYTALYTKTYSYVWNLDWKPSSNVEVIFSPELDKDWEYSQWVGAFSDPTATSTYGTRYVYGEMNQTTLVAGIRINWAFTPALSLQTYIQPFFSVANFTNFKELSKPKTYNFLKYGTGGSTVVYDSLYRVDPDGAGPAAPFTFSSPDLNFKSLRGNAVLRWEWMSGSTLYLVWTQERTNSDDPGNMRFGHDISYLFSSQPDNIFMVKVAYWLNP